MLGFTLIGRHVTSQVMTVQLDHRILSVRKNVWHLLGMALLYYGAGILGLHFTPVGCWISALWVPSGVGLGLFLLYRGKAIPGIALGSFLITLHYDFSFLAGTIHTVSNVFEAALAGGLLIHFRKGKFDFKDYQEVISFFFLAVFVAPLVSGVLELGASFYLRKISEGDLQLALLRFFMGNGLGILIFTPLMLVIHKHQNFELLASRYLECLLMLLGFSYTVYFAFADHGVFLIFPFFIWAALRFSYLGVCICSLMLMTYSAFKFGTGLKEIEILWFQILVATCSVTGHLLATVITANRKVLEKELESSINLKQKDMAEQALGVLDQAIQKSPIGFTLISSDFRFIRVNEFMAKVNGYSADFHTGKLISEIVPEISSYIEETVDFVFKSGQSMLAIPAQVRSKSDPSVVYLGLVSYYPVRLPGTKDTLGVAIVFNDMTEQHEMENKLRENQRWLNFSQEVGKMGVFECNLVNSQARWTDQLEIIYGLSKGEFDGQISTWLKFIHPEDLRTVYLAIRRAKNSGSEFSIQFRIIRKDGSIRWILCRGGTHRDNSGRISGVSGINVDITEQKTTEERLRKVETELTSALEIRDEFIAIASHELKTPLTSLKLQIQLYQRSLANNDPQALSKEKVEQLLYRNHHQALRLGRLVDDMLDISRIRSGKLGLKREICEFNQILKELLIRYKEEFLASGSGVPEVIIGPMCFGNWDSLRIEQILANVIGNAIRYGLGRPIKIKVDHLVELVRISVTDHGLGIPDTELEKIFGRFERGAKHREISGLGLGLFISKQIAVAHGGQIWVESEEGKGSTFHIELPILKFSSQVATTMDIIMA